MARLTDIASEIKTIIDSLTVAGGYNYNWSTFNETDKALVTTFPLATIRYTTDEAVDGIAGLYGMHNAEFLIEVEMTITPSATVKPEFTADAALDKCLADLCLKFRINNTGYFPLTGQSLLSYKSSEKIKNTRGSTYRPVKLVTKFNCFYHNN
jgi:hypothetical protein